MANKNMAYILDVFPGAPPFVFNEIKEIRNKGFNLILFSVNNPKSKFLENELMKDTYYVKNYLARPVLLAHFGCLLGNPLLYFSLLFGSLRSVGWPIFWKSVYFAYVIKGRGIEHLHAHFAWDAADCAQIIKKLTGITFSLTVHARDIYVEADHFQQKLEESRLIITCTEFNKRLIVRKFGKKYIDRVRVLYHGVDLRRFNPPEEKNTATVDVLSVVQRFVEKKGIEYLVEAISLLRDEGKEVSCQIIGDGGNVHKIENMIKEFGLEENIKLIKLVTQEELVSFYRKSKIFVLPCIVAEDGDRDGIPNVLAEAMAMELPVICSDLPSIAELVENDKDGLLVPERNARALAKAIADLLQDDEKRKILARNARLKVMKMFDFSEKTRILKSIFEGLIRSRTIKLKEQIVKLLRCPVCRGKLDLQEDIRCLNNGCGMIFPIVDGVPVLIDPKRSLFSVEDFINMKETYFKSRTGLAEKFFKHLPGRSINIRSAGNYHKLAGILLKDCEKPKVLILGGGVLGNGIERLLNFPIDIIETDISFGPRTMAIADAHCIPFADSSLDCVVAQGVLEHVVNPYVCAKEIYRVLKQKGLVYAETAFMQQMHGGEFDFIRFTHLGHRRLFGRFREVESGAVCGTGMALLWAYEHFLMSLAKSYHLQILAKLFARVTGFWLKYFDYLTLDNPFSLNGAAGYYFMGQKSDHGL